MKIDWTSITNNANGHPRYVCHFLALNTEKEKSAIADVSQKYNIALARAKAIGGKKYHCRAYGGGITFATFDLESTERQITAALAEATRKEGLDVNGNPIINFGDELICSETGKKFIAAQDGITTNYARDSKGNIFSDEGVDIREKRDLLDRSKPFYCYLSSDGKRVSGWKGNELGRVISETSSRSGFHGSEITYIRVIDVHGAQWTGRGAGRGMCVTLRAIKGGK